MAADADRISQSGVLRERNEGAAGGHRTDTRELDQLCPGMLRSGAGGGAVHHSERAHFTFRSFLRRPAALRFLRLLTSS